MQQNYIEPNTGLQLEPEPYKCPNCDSERIVVEETNEFMQDENGICSCSCGNCEDGVAAEQESILHCREQRWGWLDTYSDIQWNDWEFEIVEEDIVSLGVFCNECQQYASLEDWEYERSDIDPGDIDFEQIVRCWDCDREIDFPWEHFEPEQF